jgi:NAD(P)H dehydrogenase (quinone)
MELVLDMLPPAIAGGRLVSSAGEGRIAYVTREDCARAAAAALVSDFQGSRTLDITGPDAVSAEELVRIANDVLGTSISFVPVTAEEFLHGLAAAGVPEVMARVFTNIDHGVSLGAMDLVSDDFRTLTGAEPTSVADFLKAHRDVLLAPKP